jgi:hypothetical protein
MWFDSDAGHLMRAESESLHTPASAGLSPFMLAAWPPISRAFGWLNNNAVSPLSFIPTIRPIPSAGHRTTVSAVCAVCLALWGAWGAGAQGTPPPTYAGGGKWRLLDAVGYAGLGFGAGVLANLSTPTTGSGEVTILATVGTATIGGLVTGAVVGRRAEQSLSRGDALGTGQLVAFAGGAVLGGATLGALAAVPIIAPDGEGTVLGTDEQTFAILVGAGAVLGSLYVWRHWNRLTRGMIEITPATDGKGHYGLRLHIQSPKRPNGGNSPFP